MTSFLEETLKKIGHDHTEWSSLVLILPSKRACGFVRHYLKAQTTKALLAPKIISIEQLITTVSGLQLITGDQLLIEAYKAYLKTPSKRTKDSFPTFCDWASTVLADFNEMDRYLVPSNSFFGYLKEIKTLERWGAEAEEDDLTKKYLDFWHALEDYYHKLQQHLLNLNCGYQGMVYRQAVDDVEHYLQAQDSKTHVFIGFNALNAAEQHLVQAMLESGSASVYWDIDRYFYQEQQHGASRFMKRYFNNWKYYRHYPKPDPSDNYSSTKHITISNAPNQQLQVKYVGELLSRMDQNSLSKTAVVLADERLLEPLLLSLPDNLKQANITMGSPLHNMPASRWIHQLFLFQTQKGDSWYYKDLFRIIDTAIFRRIFPAAETLVAGMNKDNQASIDPAQLGNYLTEQETRLFSTILINKEQSSEAALNAAGFFLNQALETGSLSGLELQVFRQLKTLIDELNTQVQTADFLQELPALIALWELSLKQQKLDFEGDAYDGLQIMGVLETRVLDFERLIILSVNEGVLPAGRSNASYITADMKTTFSLPNFQDKDAIYTYHFFRLLQRASHVQLCYNGSSDGLTTGEPSRYITQILFDALPEHHIKRQTLSTPILSPPAPEPAQIEKSTAVIERLHEISEKGWSPSALTSYLYNPMQFYFDRVIGIRETDQLEEEIAANTMGNAVHKALENLYAPFIGKDLSLADLDGMIPKIDAEMRTQFVEFFRAGSFDRGKNLLIFEVAKRFAEQQIALDRGLLEKGDTIHLVALEQELQMDLPSERITIPIKLKGTIDRIDRLNGQLRIIDYKTGKVTAADLRIHDWSLLMESDKYLKAIQVLVYALMVEDQGIPLPYTAGVISFKNIKAGVLNFGKRDKPSSRNVDETIDHGVLATFMEQLEALILEILDPAIPFTERPQEEN